MRDYYKVLGVSHNATPDEIKAAYRKLCRQWHPDYNPGSEISGEMLKMINEAYAVLSHPMQRDDHHEEVHPNTNGDQYPRKNVSTARDYCRGYVASEDMEKLSREFAEDFKRYMEKTKRTDKIFTAVFVMVLSMAPADLNFGDYIFLGRSTRHFPFSSCLVALLILLPFAFFIYRRMRAWRAQGFYYR